MLEYKKSDPLISIHLPKCGGTSLMVALEKWFGEDLYFHYFDEKNNKMPSVVNNDVLSHDGRGVCIHGHYNKYRGFGVDDYYPDIKQFMTFLRDPLEIYISNYFFVNGKVSYRDGQKYLIEDSLNDYLEKVIENASSWYMTHFPGEIPEGRVSEYIESKFIFMGVMEQYQKSLDILAGIFDKPSIQIPKRNETKRDEYVIDDDIVKRFKVAYALDYEVYNYANQYIESF